MTKLKFYQIPAMATIHEQKFYDCQVRQVVLEPRVSPEHTWKYVDTVIFLQKLEPKVIYP